MTVFGLKTCGTCRKALAALPGATFVDVRSQGVPEDVLRRAEERFGARLLNTRSTTWRGLSDAERGKPQAALLRAHPTLMKRPLILAEDGTLHLGWDADTQDAVLNA